jgi:hypothetical protein
MTEENWVALADVPGRFQAELLRGLLEAQGIQVFLSQEGAGFAYGLTVGTLGAVQVLVPASNLEQAQEVLNDFYAALEAENDPEAEGDADAEDAPPDAAGLP